MLLFGLLFLITGRGDQFLMGISRFGAFCRAPLFWQCLAPWLQKNLATLTAGRKIPAPDQRSKPKVSIVSSVTSRAYRPVSWVPTACTVLNSWQLAVTGNTVADAGVHHGTVGRLELELRAVEVAWILNFSSRMFPTDCLRMRGFSKRVLDFMQPLINVAGSGLRWISTWLSIKHDFDN